MARTSDGSGGPGGDVSSGKKVYADREIAAPWERQSPDWQKPTTRNHNKSQGTKPPSFPKKHPKVNTRVYNS